MDLVAGLPMMPFASSTGDGRLILAAGALLVLGILASLLATRLRVPGLVLFLVLGMVIGSDVLGIIEFDDAELTRTIGIIALSLILFEGGLTTSFEEIRPVLPTAVSLALVGTLLTALLTGLAASAIFGFGLLEGLLVGSIVAATDGAAIFALLRTSTLRRRLAYALEGESGLNDAVAVLLVIGLIDWIGNPGYGVVDMLLLFLQEFPIGIVVGLAVGFGTREAMRRMELPTVGLYPVATVGAVALSYGAADVLGGSGFLAVYLTGLVLGSSAIPARRTVQAFHQGLAWVSQIGLFLALGLLVFPSQLGSVAGKGLLLAAVLMFVARPVAALVATLVQRFSFTERLLLGWAGLRGAVPVVLATFPVIAAVPDSGEFFNIVFFVVLTSTLVQGVTFEPLARRFGLTTDEPALPRPIAEVGTVRRLGAEVIEYPVEPGAACIGHPVRELDLPREALVNVIVRAGEAIPPRGSTVIESGDRLHILVRSPVRREVEQLFERWRTGPIGQPTVPLLGHLARSTVFSAGPWDGADGDPARPETVRGVAVAQTLRRRRDEPGRLVALVDGRLAVTGAICAVGPRQRLLDWARERAVRAGENDTARSWWEEVAGVLSRPQL